MKNNAFTINISDEHRLVFSIMNVRSSTINYVGVGLHIELFDDSGSKELIQQGSNIKATWTDKRVTFTDLDVNSGNSPLEYDVVNTNIDDFLSQTFAELFAGEEAALIEPIKEGILLIFNQ